MKDLTLRLGPAPGGRLAHRQPRRGEGSREREGRKVIRSRSPQEAMGHRKDCGCPPAGNGKSPWGYHRGVRRQPATFVRGLSAAGSVPDQVGLPMGLLQAETETERPPFCLILLLGSESLSPVHTRQEGTEYTREGGTLGTTPGKETKGRGRG